MNRLKKTFLLTFVLLFSLAGYAEAKNYWYSPLAAIAHATAGHRLKISVQEHHSPPSALQITADETVKDGDPQWVLLGLTVPSGTQKPHTPYFLEQLVTELVPLLVSQLASADLATRGDNPGEVIYVTDDDQLTVTLDNSGTPTRFVVPGVTWGTAAVAHNDPTNAPDGTLYFKHEA